ncbi:hypothetical protein [Psychrobacillus phage Perkons]|nr:hypothetical protein [Psychrobacillus phage Perkons]
MMYGIYLDGMLMEKYGTPEEAYESAQFAYEESGLFHEVRFTSTVVKTINEL